jgi:hypothetical protein
MRQMWASVRRTVKFETTCCVHNRARIKCGGITLRSLFLKLPNRFLEELFAHTHRRMSAVDYRRKSHAPCGRIQCHLTGGRVFEQGGMAMEQMVEKGNDICVENTEKLHPETFRFHS